MTRGLAAIALAALTWAVACGPSLDRQSQDVLETYFAARNARDEGAVRAVLADDVIFRVPAGSEFRGSADVARQVTQSRFLWEVGNVRASGDTVAWIERVTQDTPRLPNVPASFIETEMQAVVLDGLIQSVSPTSSPVPRADGSAGLTTVQPTSTPTLPMGLLGLGLAALAGGALMLGRRWARPLAQPGSSWHLLDRLRPPHPRRPKAPHTH